MPQHHKPARPATILLVLVLLCGTAEAQRGPAAGQDPVGYTASYVTESAAAAVADPVGQVEETASPAGASNVTGEAGYVACWAVYDASGVHVEPCSAFFTPPGTAERPVEEATAAPEEAEELVAEAAAVVQEAQDVVATVLEDPATAPSQVDRLVGAVAGFVAAVANIAIDLVAGLLDGLVDLGDLLKIGVSSSITAIATGGQAGLEGLRMAGVGVAAGATTVADVAQSVASTVADIAQSAASQVAEAAGAAVDAVASAATSAVQAVSDFVASIFGAEAPMQRAPTVPDAAQPLVPKEQPLDLVDGVLGAVPA